ILLVVILGGSLLGLRARYVVAEPKQLQGACLLRGWKPEIPRDRNLLFRGDLPVAHEPEMVFGAAREVCFEDRVWPAAPADEASLGTFPPGVNVEWEQRVEENERKRRG